MKQFSQVVDIKTRVSDMKILCTVDQDVFHCQIGGRYVIPDQWMTPLMGK